MNTDNIFTDYFAYNPEEDLNNFNNLPTETWLKIGEQKALENFHLAAKSVPAYQDFLKENNVDPNNINTIDDFKNLPLTNKDNYFKHYPLEDLIIGGTLSGSTVIHYSSGTTGKSLFWPKTKIQDLAGYKGMELLYKLYFDVGKHKTLFINSFGMGPWTAGEMVHTATKLMAEKGLDITVVSPGTNSKLFLDIFEGLADKFEQIIIGAYPSFLKDAIQEGIDKKIDFTKYKIKLITGGEKFSENWRLFMTKHLGFSEPHRSIASVLGLSEVGVGAISTPFIDYTRMYLYQNDSYAEKLFERRDLPSIMNFIPPARFIEIVNGTIVITSMGSVPIIRYDTRDLGKILFPQDLLKIFPPDFRSDYTKITGDESIPQLPIITIDGRADKTITMFGANIYPEQIAQAVEQPALEKFLTGQFIIEKLENESADTYLNLVLELKQSVVDGNEYLDEIQNLIVSHLISINTEFEYLLNSIGDKVKPHVVLKSHGSDKFSSIAGKTAVIRSIERSSS